MKKRPDLTSMALQDYVGENYLKVKKALEGFGLSVFCAEERGNNAPTIAVSRNVDIRFDKYNGEIIRIWRTE